MWINSTVRVLKDPRKIQTKTGTPMTTAFAGANIEGTDLFTFGIAAFGSLAEELLRYKKGDTLAITGMFKANEYSTQAGEERKGYQVVADGLAGVKRRNPVQRAQKSKPKKTAPDYQADGFDDELTF